MRNPTWIPSELRRPASLGSPGAVRYQGTDRIDTPLEVPADYETVQYVWIIDQDTGLPAYVDASTLITPSANDKARGFGGQIGDLVNPITSAGYGVTLYAPWEGEITELIFQADVACAAVMDVKKNGTSIFTGSSVKPTLSASQTDDKTDMTDITVAFVKGDRFDLVLESVGSDPKLLSLTIFSETV